MENVWQILWIVLVLVFIVSELITPTFSFFVWFAGGAAVSGYLAYLRVPPILQIIAFLAVSALLIIATKPLQKRLLKVKDETMDTKNRLIGKKVKLLDEVNNYKESGSVFVEGSYWKVKSYNDEEIYAKDDIVTVIDVEGIVLVVKK